MAKYRKKPVIVEAAKWMPSYFHRPSMGKADELGVVWEYGPDGEVSNGTVITIHGQKTKVAIGDWVIEEPDRIHQYPCKPDIFEQTYEKVE